MPSTPSSMLIQPSKPTPASSLKDGVVVVHPFADLAVPQPAGIADAVFFLAQVFDRALGQVAVAGVHRDHAMFHARQELERVFARQKRVARVVVDAERRRVDPRRPGRKTRPSSGRTRDTSSSCPCSGFPGSASRRKRPRAGCKPECPRPHNSNRRPATLRVGAGPTARGRSGRPTRPSCRSSLFPSRPAAGETWDRDA